MVRDICSETCLLRILQIMILIRFILFSWNKERARNCKEEGEVYVQFRFMIRSSYHSRKLKGRFDADC